MRKQTVSLLILFLLLFILVQQVAAKTAPRACPVTQAGTVEATIPPEGVTIILVDYPCDWSTPPVLVASPSGEGSFWVERFEVNSLTGSEGSIAVRGEPGGGVRFGWVASVP